MSPITARYTFTIQDHMAGGMYILRHRLSKKVIDVLIFVMLANLLWNARDDFNLRVFYFSILPFLLVATILKLLPWIALRCSYAKQADANMELLCSFTESAVVVASAVSKTESKWTAFKKVIFLPGGFLFMPSMISFNFIPIRAFETPADIENLKSLARQHAPEFKSLK